MSLQHTPPAATPIFSQLDPLPFLRARLPLPPQPPHAGAAAGAPPALRCPTRVDCICVCWPCAPPPPPSHPSFLWYPLLLLLLLLLCAPPRPPRRPDAFGPSLFFFHSFVGGHPIPPPVFQAAGVGCGTPTRTAPPAPHTGIFLLSVLHSVPLVLVLASPPPPLARAAAARRGNLLAQTSFNPANDSPPFPLLLLPV